MPIINNVDNVLYLRDVLGYSAHRALHAGVGLARQGIDSADIARVINHTDNSDPATVAAVATALGAHEFCACGR